MIYNAAMFRLWREVRFALNPQPDDQLRQPPANSFAGFPTPTTLGPYLRLQVAVSGQPDAASAYLMNIKDIDQTVRQKAIPLAAKLTRQGQTPEAILLRFFDTLRDQLPLSLDRLRLCLNPFLSVSLFAQEHPMIRLSQKFEFCASHRLHNPALSDEENRRLFGKCNNPHGHNYVLEVTLTTRSDDRVLPLPEFERLVTATVIEPLDHKNLNLEVPQFQHLNPTVENIAMVIYRMLQPEFHAAQATLAAVTVWETSKTWCEYSE